MLIHGVGGVASTNEVKWSGAVERARTHSRVESTMLVRSVLHVELPPSRWRRRQAKPKGINRLVVYMYTDDGCALPVLLQLARLACMASVCVCVCVSVHYGQLCRHKVEKKFDQTVVK